MMRKVKVKRPKNSSTFKRMKASKLELPTAQFGASIIGGTSQPDPGNTRTDTKEDAIERANRDKASLGNRFKYGIAGFVAPALEWVGAEGVGEKWEEKAIESGAGKAFHVGNSVGEVGSAVGKFFTGDYQGMAGDLAEAGGSAITARGYGQWEKGNDEKSEKLIKAGESIEGIGNMVTKTSFSGGMSGGMKGGMKGANKSGFVKTGVKGVKGVNGVDQINGIEGIEGIEGIDGGMDFLSGGMSFAKFGTKLPLEMELMPENGKMVDGYLHKEGGVITTDRKKPVAEIEGGEGIIEDVVFSNTTINSETGKPFSKDAERLINSKDTSKEGKNTQRLEKERLYIKQEEEKIKQGLVNRGEEMAMKKYKKGGSLKTIPSDNKGLPQLPESVRNQMGYMKSGGGLYANIHAKRERIRKGSGERLRKPGTEGAPTNKDFVRSERTAKETAMYGKKLNLPKMQGGDVIDPTIIPEGEVMYNLFGSQNMQMPTPSNKSVPLPNFKGMPSDEDIFSYGAKKEDPGTLGKEMIPGEKDFTKSQIKNVNKLLKEREGGKGNLTPGDIQQIFGNTIPAAANLTAIPTILKNTADFPIDQSIVPLEKVSTDNLERAARQQSATIMADSTINPAYKSAVAVGTTKNIQDAILEGEKINKEYAKDKALLDKQTIQFNIGQKEKKGKDKQTRKDLAITTALTGAEQVGKTVVDSGTFRNAGDTNRTQLEVLKNAFPDYTINADNIKSFIKALSSGKEEEIYKFRKPEGE